VKKGGIKMEREDLLELITLKLRSIGLSVEEAKEVIDKIVKIAGEEDNKKIKELYDKMIRSIFLDREFFIRDVLSLETLFPYSGSIYDQMLDFLAYTK